MSVRTPITPAKLAKAIEAADDRSRRARELRKQAMQEYVGRYYNEDDGKQRPMNLVYRSCRVLQSHLTHNSPKYTISTDNAMIRGEALVLGMLVSQLMEELDFARMDKLLLLDALLSPRAVVRMGMKSSAETVTMEGRDLNPGQWYIRRVSPDDHVIDPRANRPEEAAWEGDRYRVSKDALLDSGVFDREAIERLATLPRRDRDAETRAEQISGKKADKDYELIDTVELIDVFFYDVAGSGRTVKVTMATEYETQEYLRVEEYEGPERGPYAWLEFDPIPDNISALPPVAGYREQSENVNNILAKVLEQLAKSKRVPVVSESTPTDEINALRTAGDGDIWKTSDSSGAKVLDMSFVSPEALPIGQMFLQYANTMAGNPDMMGGTGSGAKTATEFSGLMSTAGGIIDALAGTHDAFLTKIGRHAMWYLVRDPLIKRGTTKRIPGGFQIPVVYDAEQREGDFEDFMLKVEPGSTIRIDENVKAKRLMELAAMVPQLVQTEMVTQGGFSARGTLKVLARRLGETEIDEMLPDPALIQEAAMKYAAIPQVRQGVPGAGSQQTRPIDAVRSAMSAGVPAA